MSKALTTCQRTFPSHPGQLENLRAWVAELQSKIGGKRFPEKALQPVTLSLIEAVNNAIFHAHRGMENAVITVHFEFAEQAIGVEVIDQGKGFQLHDWCELPEMQSDHGRGIFLMRQLMHEVSNKIENNQHTVRMVYHL